MLNFQLNRATLKKQLKLLFLGLAVIVIIVVTVTTMLADYQPKTKTKAATPNLTGVVDASFSESNTESALSLQQQELDTVKSRLSEISATIKEANAEHAKQMASISTQFQEKMETLSQTLLAKDKPLPKQELWYGQEQNHIVPAVYNANLKLIWFPSLIKVNKLVPPTMYPPILMFGQ